MPTVGVHLYSAVFKAALKHRFSRRDGSFIRVPTKGVPPNASFVDGIATKDIIINKETGLSVRIYLPECCIQEGRPHGFAWMVKRHLAKVHSNPVDASGHFELEKHVRSGSDGGGDPTTPAAMAAAAAGAGSAGLAGAAAASSYRGYIPSYGASGSSGGSSGSSGGHVNSHRLPVMVEFHSGGFVLGSKDSSGNDMLCRRLARVCSIIVVAVGFRLAPEHRCPAAYDDGFEALRWLAHQSCLAANDTSPSHVRRAHKEDIREVAPALTHELAEPWLAAHADVSRCVLVGASSGGNIANHVARRAATVEGMAELAPLTVIAQVLMYPLFGGERPTPSELKRSGALFYDRATCELVWQLYLPDGEYSLDHPAVNPLLDSTCPPGMPPTLTIVAELDLLRDRAVAYSLRLRELGVDAHVTDFQDVPHGFATMEFLINTPQAESCAEEIAIWVNKHTSPKGGELSY
eukprot:jgi/Mesen1/7520/ME000039S06741